MNIAARAQVFPVPQGSIRATAAPQPRRLRESGAWLLIAAWLAYSGALLFQLEARTPGGAICTTPARS